ncbi:MAG: HAD family phosphatase [Candidatus Sumerlaeia bacterium]|nr:HAD family phosphatase [Candidatus Sumerlaeia bacterium]
MQTLDIPAPVTQATEPFDAAAAQPFTFRGRALRALIFDMDGVIADTQHAHRDAWLLWARKNGIPLDEETFMRDYFGRSNLDVLPLFFPEHAHDREFILRMGEDKEEHFLQRLRAGEIPPLDGFYSVIARARSRGFGLAVGSSSPRRNVETVLGHFGVRRLFPVTVSQQDVPISKPAPDIFLSCVAQLGLQPHECLVFEDSLHGLEAARKAGCPSVGIATMHTPEELAGHCDLVAPHFEALLQTEEWQGL